MCESSWPLILPAGCFGIEVTNAGLSDLRFQPAGLVRG
jgi:hypothetical protein